MASRRIRRNAATTKGLERRIEDLALKKVSDPRDERWVKYPLVGMLKLLIYGLLTGCRSMRAVEDRSEQPTPELELALGLGERVSDNAMGELLQRLSPGELVEALRQGALAEYRRKGLKAQSLPWNLVAVDGKHVATIPEADLRRLLDDDPQAPAPAEGLRVMCSARFPEVQMQDGAGGAVGLIRIHNVTLVSSAAAVVLYQRAIAGNTNEIGSMNALIREVFGRYGRTDLLQVFSLDAGNTSQAVGEELRTRGAHYLAKIAVPHGDIYREAVACLGQQPISKAAETTAEPAKGAVVEHFIWTADLPTGHLAWHHARQLIRVQRDVTYPDGTVRTGTRYLVTSMPPTVAEPAALLEAVRAHWRIENETHWTADARWDEDAIRTPWTRHPHGILVVAVLRAVAINIAAVLRALSRYLEDPDAAPDARVWLKPTWKRVVETFLLLCFVAPLDTSEFDVASHA